MDMLLAMRSLRSLFNYLAENIRPTDFLARYGGDELTLINTQCGSNCC